jgi:putative addiction module component (TIGR02574 family)
MTATAKRILSAALRLNAEERYGLAEQLLGARAEDSSQEEVDSAWALELDRRLRAIRRGAPQGDDWAVVEKRLRARLR